MSFNMNIPLFKIDEEQRLVYGRATQEVVDKAGEVMDYESSKPMFEKWSNDFATRTRGKSYGNVRIQHDAKRVGGKIAEPLRFNDADKAIDVCVKVSDMDLFEKIKEGYYTGFSIGGSYGNQWRDDDGTLHYTAVPSELSIVDNPCCGAATIEYVKADGSVEMKEVRKVDKEKETQVEAQEEVQKTVEVAESETVEKAVEEEAKEEKPVEKADEPKEDEKEDSKEEAKEEQEEEKEEEVEKSADMVKEDVFEMCSKAMDNADDSIKEKCGKLFHKMVEKGLYCKCGKCAKAIEGEKAEKAAADNDLHKTVESDEPMQKFAPADELAKAMGVIDELKKGFDALKSDNDALKKQVEKLENEPVAGGAIMANGTVAFEKTIGDLAGNAPAPTVSEADMLRKMIDEADSPMLKEAYSAKLANLEMKKVFG